MDFLSKLDGHSKPDPSKPDHSKPAPSSTDPDRHKSTNSDLIHSAKVVADVAKAHIRHEPDKYDKAEAAGATADLLNAAQEYGKLGDQGVGKYIDKAEDYLRHYNGSQPADAKTAAASGGHAGGEDLSKKPSSHGGENPSSHGGGAGDFLKNMAGDFLKK